MHSIELWPRQTENFPQIARRTRSYVPRSRGQNVIGTRVIVRLISLAVSLGAVTEVWFLTHRIDKPHAVLQLTATHLCKNNVDTTNVLQAWVSTFCPSQLQIHGVHHIDSVAADSGAAH